MAWLELKIDTLPSGIEAAAAALTAAGFEDLVLEDQAEFETFLEGNKAYWDYIDEDLRQKLQGLSCIKLYLEDTDEAGMQRLRCWKLCGSAPTWAVLRSPSVPCRKQTGRKAGKTIIPLRKWAAPWWCFPTGSRMPIPRAACR